MGKRIVLILLLCCLLPLAITLAPAGPEGGNSGRALYVAPSLPQPGRVIDRYDEYKIESETVSKESVEQLLATEKYQPPYDLADRRFALKYGKQGLVLCAQVAAEVEILEIVNVVVTENARPSEDKMELYKKR